MSTFPSDGPAHCVVQYFFVHSADEAYSYPTGRNYSDPQKLTALYLECALVQAASLALRDDVACEQVFVWNLADPHDESVLGAYGVRLVRAMEALGVQMRHAEFAHRFDSPAAEYMASRYILDAIHEAVRAARDDQVLWFTDLDCVWRSPERVFAAAPKPSEVGCLYIPYPPDWDVMLGTTPTTVGRFGERLGACKVPVPWVGGEILSADPATLRHFVEACERVERAIGQEPGQLPAEEHLFSLVGGLDYVQFKDLSAVCRRIQTGARHTGPRFTDVASLGFWHLPGEKGLAFRRTAKALLRGRHGQLAREFADPELAMRRFNVGRPKMTRRLRDDSWLAVNRLLRATARG
jgi:hypothetical protein